MESIVFHVEYRWNGITKMAGISPKTYSMWNGWNPPGMIWIPYGFPVECRGRVKTSSAGSMTCLFFNDLLFYAAGIALLSKLCHVLSIELYCSLNISDEPLL